jgi:hypothetical protein
MPLRCRNRLLESSKITFLGSISRKRRGGKEKIKMRGNCQILEKKGGLRIKKRNRWRHNKLCNRTY